MSQQSEGYLISHDSISLLFIHSFIHTANPFPKFIRLLEILFANDFSNLIWSEFIFRIVYLGYGSIPHLSHGDL